MSDYIERDKAIETLETDCSWDIFDTWGNYTNVGRSIIECLKELPSAQPESSFVSWLLDEVWDEDVWELNWQAFPEVLCRKLAKLGYIKEKDGEYERLDK